MAFDPSSDYPLGANRPDLVRTPGGHRARRARRCTARESTRRELRATPETLRLQAEVARASGRLAARRQPRCARPSSRPCPTRRSSRSTRRCARAGRRRRSSRRGRSGSTSWERAAHRRVRPRGRAGLCGARPACSLTSALRGSSRGRRAACAARCSIEPLAELGLVAMDGPNDPAPSLVVEDGRVVELDGRREAGLGRARPLRRPLRARPRRRRRGGGARRRGDRAAARRRRRAARRARSPLARPDAGAARAGHRAARSGRADVRAEEAARAADAGEPGARHEPEGEPGAARRRRGRGGGARLRRDRDDGRRLALRAAERDRDPRRLADRPAGRDDAVRGRGAAEPAARDPGPRHLRRDAVRVRHRAGVRRRRRHAVVEGVPRLGVRVARRSRCASRRAAAPRR